ncbi:MAG: DUF5683 domain-containing protein [Flavobacteriales bacterium]
MKQLLLLLLFFFANVTFAQKSDTLIVKKEKGVAVKKSNFIKKTYNPLAPAKAAFYSAVLPGLGQVYNKKYWKIPIIYAGMGVGIYFYQDNNKNYNKFRDIYKRRLAGFTDDEFWGDGETPLVSNERLRDAQKTAQKNKDVSVVVAIGFYLLNIIDANVDAHLRQFNVNDDLSFEPKIDFNAPTSQANFGMSLKYHFK